jgi:hypothetical protein
MPPPPSQRAQAQEEFAAAVKKDTHGARGKSIAILQYCNPATK